MRINKFISANSKHSRRKADELIENGKVKVNGEIVKEMGLQVEPENDSVEVDGKKINSHSEEIYFALNKPEGYVSTRSDEHGRPTIMDLLPNIPSLKPVGRLDIESEGLILISNDGKFINQHTHPKFECEKEYLVKITGVLSDEEKENLEKGVMIDDKKTSPAKVYIQKKKKNESTVKIIIHEGRNRQVRKMFAKVGHPVKYLKRLRIGSIELGKLRKGTFRNLSKKEIDDNKPA